MNPALHSVSVAAAIFDDHGRVLLVKRRDNSKLEPPGGVMELHEGIEEALMREVREETGLEVGVEELTGVYKNMSRGIVALVFRAHVVGGTLETNDEASEFIWLDPAALDGQVEPVYAIRLRDAAEHACQARDHDGVRVVHSLSKDVSGSN